MLSMPSSYHSSIPMVPLIQTTTVQPTSRESIKSHPMKHIRALLLSFAESWRRSVLERPPMVQEKFVRGLKVSTIDCWILLSNHVLMVILVRTWRGRFFQRWVIRTIWRWWRVSLVTEHGVWRHQSWQSIFQLSCHPECNATQKTTTTKGHTSCSPNKTVMGEKVVEELTGTFSFTAVISVPNMPKCYSTSYVFPMTWNTTQDGLKGKSTTLTSRHWTFPPSFSEWLGSTWWNEVWFFDGLSQVVLWGGLPHHPTQEQLWWALCSCPVLQGFSCEAYVQDCLWTQSFCCRWCAGC